jgi:hypothetical protein
VSLLLSSPMRTLLVGAFLLAACSRDKKPSEGLPAASEWKANAAGQMVQQGGDIGGMNNLPPPAPPPGMANTHGGEMGDSDDPHAGLGIPPPGTGGSDDPHAGLDMNGSGNPHGSGGVDVTQMGLPAPDPNRQIDPTRFVKGVIKIHEKARSRAKAGTALFLVVKRAGPDGSPIGSPLAVEKLEWNASGELPFALTEAQAMVGGTELVGDVVVTARYDQDGDALSKEPGDITGSAHVTLPANNVTVVLDTIL